MEYTSIRVEVADHIATVTIDRPPANLLSRGLQDEMTHAFDSFTDRDDVRAVILTAAGKVFCGGLDIKATASADPQPGDKWAARRSWRECTYSIMECKKPVIAAVNGPALGAGLALVASCDILFASSSAEIGLPEINVGVLGGARRAMRLFGHSKVRRMMFTGHRVSGAELARLGVVEACVEPQDLLPTAMDVAREIASKSPVAMKLAKLAVGTIEEMSVRDGYRFEQDMTDELSRYEDSREAMRAFVEKRAPNFKGR